ncbi:MAG: hypothetical protein AB7T06_27835 [Kofleriaceae bacterium]
MSRVDLLDRSLERRVQLLSVRVSRAVVLIDALQERMRDLHALGLAKGKELLQQFRANGHRLRLPDVPMG